MKREWKFSLSGACLLHVGMLSAIQFAPSHVTPEVRQTPVEFELLRIEQIETPSALASVAAPQPPEAKLDPVAAPPSLASDPLLPKTDRIETAPEPPSLPTTAPQVPDSFVAPSQTPAAAAGDPAKPSFEATAKTSPAFNNLEQQPATSRSTRAIPKYRNNPEAIYPAQAKRRRQQGLVLLAVRVGSTGQPLKVELKQSSGFPSLDEAALKAVRGWEFEPARVGDLSLESQIEVPVRFKLNN